MRRLRLPALLTRFAQARRGATAVEFAIIALPFCVLLFGIIELGLVFMVSVTLQNATDSAARHIRTGQFQTSGSNAKADFKTLVCNRMSWLATPCTSKLTVAVQTFANFAAASGSNPTAGTAFTRRRRRPPASRRARLATSSWCAPITSGPSSPRC